MAWLPTLVFLPGEFHGQRSLVSYSPWGRKELDRTEHSLINTVLAKDFSPSSCEHETYTTIKVRNIFKWSMLLNETLQQVLFFFFTSLQHGSISRPIHIDLMVTNGY